MKDGQRTFFQNPTEIENLKRAYSFVIFFQHYLSIIESKIMTRNRYNEVKGQI